MERRTFLRFLAGALAAPFLPRPATAEPPRAETPDPWAEIEPPKSPPVSFRNLKTEPVVIPIPDHQLDSLRYLYERRREESLKLERKLFEDTYGLPPASDRF